ncbi:hypothetical protein F7Q99_29940 [Streptomyces kaniharaensis]|uniref:DUF7691 domain-containing protein n=1 Tax=Streptomyces kaniharaensis TaxID=212423 RepID=A0A6N7L3C5_9ACTN|nr:hypothetical protein [Streptomyces kaniharaensis]MQS16323.1 hypothetical protein [Streptomyces kaniharaensis]
MSSGLSVYWVDPTEMRALVGSGNEPLLQAVRYSCEPHLAADDDYFSRQISEGAPTSLAALEAVMRGGPFSTDPHHAFQYGYAYRRLCERLGETLDNSEFMPFRGGWLETVDEGLRAVGVTAVSVAEFGGHGGMPSVIPTHDLPRSGEWSHERCLAALEEYEKGQGADQALAPEIVAAIAIVVGWLRDAASRAGFGVVGFVA